ncbi:MAG: NAD(P)H-dependent oxidoreductase [Alphaproteobacteria bacterium]|nr:NAD(P)H-dependent oxidoreductase [Alphaproteobacteria bacterium]
MARIAIIVGHARRDTFCETLAGAYKRGAEAGGHTADLFVLSRMSFDPILHEGFSKEQKLEPDLQAAQDAIGRADHLVLVFPLWMGTLPAILKGFIERVFQPGFAMDRAESDTGYTPRLKGKSARIIMTMGMPALVYRWWYGGHALKMLKRNILHFVGIAPVRTSVFGMVATVSDAMRKHWIDKVEAMGRAAR